MANAGGDEVLIPKPITDWIIKILSNLYNDEEMSEYTGIDMKKMIFFDLIHLLQVCKTPDSKLNLKFKMKTKKCLNKTTGVSELMICIYGPLLLTTSSGDVKLFVDIFIPRHDSYKISKAPIVLIDFEETLRNNSTNETLKYWLKDSVKFKDDYLQTDQWMALEFKKRNLVNLAEKVLKFGQTSLHTFETEYKKRSAPPPKIIPAETHKTAKVPELTKQLNEINILDDVNLEKELKEKMKENKKQLLVDLQNKIDNIHDTAIPAINIHNEKRQRQLQEFIKYYEDELHRYKYTYQFVESLEGHQVANEDTRLFSLLKDAKPLSNLALTEIVDISNINFESQYENWYIEKQSKLDAYRQLFEDLKPSFVKSLLRDSDNKSSADLIDFDTPRNNKDYENLKTQLTILENIAAEEFNVRFDLIAYDRNI